MFYTYLQHSKTPQSWTSLKNQAIQTEPFVQYF